MTAISAEERQELSNSVRSVCDRMAGEERVREIAYGTDSLDRGYDAKLWAVLCQQVGISAIAIPEPYGGAGLGYETLGVVAHELGRVLAPVPFLASAVMATGLLVEVGAPVHCVAQLVDGERTATAVLAGNGGQWSPHAVALTAQDGGDGWRISGSARHVLHGAAADVVVLVADTNGQRAVFTTDRNSSGLTVTAERVLDDTRPMATLQFDNVAATKVSQIDSDAVDAVVQRCADRCLTMLTAEQVGALERVLEIAVDYARTRQQFGRPIGSFQSIKHRCADILVSLEMSRSASLAAQEAADGADDTELRWRASMAKAVCSEALREASHVNVQIHGGIGFTWEGVAGLYLKRARTDEVLFGSAGAHWDALIDVAGVSCSAQEPVNHG